MATVEGVDYSRSRPSPAGLYSAGKRFAGRYVGVGSAAKRLTPPEAQALCGAGLSIVALCEEYANSALLGFARGRMHASAALLEATACGMPTGRPIFFAVDFDASAAQLSTVANYFEGVATVLYRNQIGAYGGIRTLRYLFDRGLIGWGFQTYAWSAGAWESRAQLRQYRNGVTAAGGVVDLCRGMVADYGQWVIGGAGSPGEDDEMPTPEELWGADLIPVGGDASNPTWKAKNALGWAVDLAEKANDKLDALAARVEALETQSIALEPSDVETIVAQVTDAVTERIGLIPTAGEVARATAALLRDHMPE